MHPPLRSALLAYQRRLVALLGSRIHKLILFGSFARGDANEDSDVDVLVLVDDLTPAEVGLVAGEVAPIVMQSGLPLAPLPLATEHFEELRRAGSSLAAEIATEGKPL